MNLEDLVQEDFGIQGNGRYKRALEHDSLVVDTEKQVFYWNSRGIYGDIEDYLRKVRGVDPRTVDFLHSHSINVRKLIKQTYPVEIASRFHRILFFDLNRLAFYFCRGITLETIRALKLGYSPRGYYTIPIINYGKLENIQMRTETVRGKKKVRKLFSQGRPSIFNEEVFTKSNKVFIVEGLLDAILLWQLGFPAVSSDSSLGFYDYVPYDYLGEFYLIQDNDQAGMEYVKKWVGRFGLHRVRWFNWKTVDGREKEDVVSLWRRERDYTYLQEVFREERNYYALS